MMNQSKYNFSRWNWRTNVHC